MSFVGGLMGVVRLNDFSRCIVFCLNGLFNDLN